MKAVTLRRPWPALIVWAGKRIENRGWAPTHRGTFAVHAGKTWDKSAFDFADGIGWPTSPGIDLPDDPADQCHATGIVAVADLVDICWKGYGWPPGQQTCDCGPWAMPGQAHWRIDNVRALPAVIPCRGYQGWWDVPPAVLAAIGHHLQGATPC